MMSVNKDALRLDIYVIADEHDKHGVKKGILEILAHLQPKWKDDDICIKYLSGSYINQIWTVENSTDLSCRLVVRVSTDDPRHPHVDREYEFEMYKRLGEVGVAPDIYCKFKNGFVVDYEEGETLETFPFGNADKFLSIQRKVIKTICKLNKLDMPERSNPTDFQPYNLFYHYLTLIEDSPDKMADPDHQKRFEEAVPIPNPIPTLKKIARSCKVILKDMFSRYPQLFCHTDAWCGNIVFNEKTEKLTFLDWELAMYSILPFELGVVIKSFSWFQETDIRKYHQRLSEPSTWKSWICLYFEQQGWPAEEEVIEQWYKDTVMASMIHTFSEIGWTLWIMKQVTDESEKKEFFRHTADGWTYFKFIKKIIATHGDASMLEYE